MGPDNDIVLWSSVSAKIKFRFLKTLGMSQSKLIIFDGAMEAAESLEVVEVQHCSVAKPLQKG